MQREQTSRFSGTARAGLVGLGFLAGAALFSPSLFGEAAPAASGPSPEMLQTLASNTSGFKGYTLNCVGCHRADGSGLPANGIPDLRGSIGMFTHTPEGRDYLIRVPGSSDSLLDNQELTEVLNWMIANYGGDDIAPDFYPYTIAEVGAARPYRFDDPAVARAEVAAGLAELGLEPAEYLYGKNPGFRPGSD